MTEYNPVLQSIDVKGPEQEQVYSLQYLIPHRAHKAPSHVKEPSGTQCKHFTQLRNKSNHITLFLWLSVVNRTEATLFHHACYLPLITYPLTCLYFTKQYLDRIQCRPMMIITTRSGLNRNTTKEILFGPIQCGGAGFHHLYNKEGYQQILRIFFIGG